jgi:hypothetical protein
LTDVDVAGAKLDQPPDRFLLVIDGRGRQIEMETILARLLLRDWQEDDPESGFIRRHETDLTMGVVVYLPAQSIGPEARETERIVRIKAEGDEPRSHRGLHLPCHRHILPPQLCRGATGFGDPLTPRRRCNASGGYTAARAYSSVWLTMLITLPSGARTKNLRTLHASSVSG